MPSRRLKHFKSNYKFYISDKDNPNLAKVIYDNIDESVKIYQKYKSKGHTKEKEIKHIDKKIEIVNKNSVGIIINLLIHVHHYTSLYFDEEYYYSLLSKELKLKHGDVMQYDNALKMYSNDLNKKQKSIVSQTPNIDIKKKKNSALNYS